MRTDYVECISYVRCVSCHSMFIWGKSSPWIPVSTIPDNAVCAGHVQSCDVGCATLSNVVGVTLPSGATMRDGWIEIPVYPPTI